MDVSALRAFAAQLIVLFDDDHGVGRASVLPAAVVEAHADLRAHVNGYVTHATDDLLARPEA